MAYWEVLYGGQDEQKLGRAFGSEGVLGPASKITTTCSEAYTISIRALVLSIFNDLTSRKYS